MRRIRLIPANPSRSQSGLSHQSAHVWKGLLLLSFQACKAGQGESSFAPSSSPIQTSADREREKGFGVTHNMHMSLSQAWLLQAVGLGHLALLLVHPNKYLLREHGKSGIHSRCFCGVFNSCYLDNQSAVRMGLGFSLCSCVFNSFASLNREVLSSSKPLKPISSWHSL